MKFQSRHFNATADLLHDMLKDADLLDYQALMMVATKFADMFARDNPRFNRDRFLTASGAGFWNKPQSKG
jgi:hypothetical protein